jgi:hypothetical protein
MKTLSSFLAVVTLVSGAQAALRTVSNAVGQPAQYTDLQTAITASSAGDTVYVMGSGSPYGSVTIDRPITLIGAGYAPPAPAFATTIGSISLTMAGSGSRIMGVAVPSTFYLYGNSVTVERCSAPGMYLTTGSTNNVIRHCYLSYLDMGQPASLLLSNNIIHSSGYFSSSVSSSVIITNNLFMGYPTYALYSISNALITNNIFWGSTPVNSTVTNCTFNKNITYQTADNTLPYGSNTGTGNQINVNPYFTNAPNNAINYTYNYQLLAFSTGNDAGTDGTDIGIYGGVAPMPGLGGVPRIPRITQFDLQYSVVPQGGSLNVQVKAKKID